MNSGTGDAGSTRAGQNRVVVLHELRFGCLAYHVKYLLNSYIYIIIYKGVEFCVLLASDLRIGDLLVAAHLSLVNCLSTASFRWAGITGVILEGI